MNVKPAIKHFRMQRGLTQQELATMSGLSRQSLNQIENGSSVPSTAIALQLARALGCKVEDLFELDDPRELRATIAQPLSPSSRNQATRAVVAQVGGRWIAHRLDPRERPYDLTLAADAVLAGKKVQPLVDQMRLAENLIVAGCDPALALLANRTDRNAPGSRNVWLQATSGRALESLERSEVHIAGAHLFDDESGEYNVPFVRRSFAGRKMIVVTLAQIEEGLAVPRGNPKKIQRVSHLLRKGVRFINRDESAAARKLLERLLAEEGAAGREIEGYEQIAPGHLEAATAVATGAADAAMVTCGSALALGLDFVPMAVERFDLVVPKEWLSDRRASRLLETLASGEFRRELAAIGGYSAQRSGSIAAEL
jgi:molybdate-binding protein/DNA-binding XRE family transcriptional regulator